MYGLVRFIDASPIAQAIVKLMDQRTVWQGFPKDLLSELNRVETNESVKKSKAWVSTSEWMGRTLNRIAPDLRALGIDIDNDPRNRKSGGVWLVIEKVAILPTLPTLPTQPSPSMGLRDVGKDVSKNGVPNLPTSMPNLPTSAPSKGSSENDVGKNVNDVGKQNLPTSLEHSPSKDDVGNVGNVGKNGLSSSRGTHEQPSLLPHEYLADPDPPHYYDIEDGNKTW